MRAVLFDAGGPIDVEAEPERLIDLRIRQALAAAGFDVDGTRYAQAARWAVEAFAPDTYAAILAWF